MSARTATLPFWLLCGVLAPLLLLQGIWTRRTARRLPVGAGPTEGITGGTGPALSLLFVGESPVAGIGCARMDQAIAARTAEELARLTGRPVRWHAAGANGIRIRQTLQECLPKLPAGGHDFVIGVHGVNDTTGLTTVSQWCAVLADLARRLAGAHGGRIVYTQVPPMHLLTALPQPLRLMVGLRARILDAALHGHPARGRLFEVIDADFPLETKYLAEDGYHPSADGCVIWAQQIAAGLAALLPQHDGGTAPSLPEHFPKAGRPAPARGEPAR